MQLPLPLVGRSGTKPAATTWVLASLDEPAWRFASDIVRHQHFFVDSHLGSRAIEPWDTIVLKDAKSSQCQILTSGLAAEHVGLPTDLPAGIIANRSHEQQPVRSLIAVILGSDRMTRMAPAHESSRLERLITMLRNSEYDGVPWTRFNRAVDALSLFGQTADKLLLALLAREAADAARTLSHHTQSSVVSREQTRRLHLEASAYFEGARMPSYSRQTDKLFRNWDCVDSAPLPVFNFEPSHTSGRVTYRCVRVLAFKTRVASPFDAYRTPNTTAVSRRLTSDWEVGEPELSAWLSGVRGGKLEPWHNWTRNAAGVRVLEVGVETEFSIQLGLAGRTGLKEDSFRVDLWGDGCEILPNSAKVVVGKPTQIQVVRAARESAVELLFTNSLNARVKLRVEVPNDELIE
jgi:hypothetical protein